MTFDAALLRIALASLLLNIFLLTGCDAYRIPGIYRIDIQQGNVVTQEMLAQIKPGIEREKARFILGTPLITDVFHEDRWDYIYLFDGAGGREHRNLTLYFEDGKLLRLEGKAAPDSEDTPSAQNRVVTVPEKKKPWWQTLFGDSPGTDAAAGEVTAQAGDQTKISAEDIAAKSKGTPGDTPTDGAANTRPVLAGVEPSKVATKNSDATPTPAPRTHRMETSGDAAVAEALVTPRAAADPENTSAGTANRPAADPATETPSAKPVTGTPIVIPAPSDRSSGEREKSVPTDTPKTGAISIPL